MGRYQRIIFACRGRTETIKKPKSFLTGREGSKEGEKEWEERERTRDCRKGVHTAWLMGKEGERWE